MNEHNLVGVGLSVLARTAKHLKYVNGLQVAAPFHD